MAFEKEVIDAFEDMKCAAIEHGEKEISDEALAILVAAKKQDEMSRKIASEICMSIDGLRPEYGLELTLGQANAIIDMENNLSCGESPRPEDEESCEGWGELLELAELIAGRKADCQL
jgi:hypothetical protein